MSPAAVPALPPVCQHHEGEARTQRHGDVRPHAHLQEGLHVDTTWAHLQLKTQKLLSKMKYSIIGLDWNIYIDIYIMKQPSMGASVRSI